MRLLRRSSRPRLLLAARYELRSAVDGDYRILVPPGKDVTLMVTAMGARSNRTQIPVAPLRLEPGQHVYMDISVRQ